MPRDGSRLIVPARCASKVTVCEGAAAMVAKKTAGSPPEQVVGKAARKPAAARRTAAAARKAAAASAGAEAAAQAARQTGARKVVAKKSTGTARKTADAVVGGGMPAGATAAPAAPGELAVRPGEDPWTPAEVAEARTGLTDEAVRLRDELHASDEAITGLMRDSGDGAGDDQADTGTKNITRESEMALAANAREMLEQTERALERLDAGTYGLCESCGKPIGKARMQAFPRATLCVDCKQKQERRH
ncbi:MULTISPECIES: TraR/DksA family transcriptional regulator [Streptomyces]|uniref:TraR/DksA family transcriptional regulator n=1 Tax=Streptomyces sp. 2P-4 TaxID=2931974 RepID=UPI0015754597|nr:MULTISPECIES: TraR/DksA family transcriptional regulator [Streptomyces]